MTKISKVTSGAGTRGKEAKPAAAELAPAGLSDRAAGGRGEPRAAALAPPEETRRLFEEMRLAKERAERQNEELRRSLLELEGSKALYAELVRERTAELESRNARLEVEIAERKKAEAALSQSEQRYRAVVEDQTELITRFRPDGSYTFVNQAFCRFFGRTQDEVLGTSWRPGAFAEDLPAIQKRLRLISPGHPEVAVENRVISGSGEVRWMQVVNRGIFDAEGRLVETQAVGRDITERKHAEEMLLIYANEVQDLYNKATCGYHSLDQNGVFLRINDTELGWLGYQRHEIVGVKHFSELVTPEGAEVFRKVFPKFLAEGHISDLEYEMVRKDGSRLPVILNSEVVRDGEGRYQMSRGTVFNNVERKQAEEELRRSEERYRGIFENAPFGIFQSTLDGRVQSVNPKFAEIFGYPSPERMLADLADGSARFFVHPEQRDDIVSRTLASEGYVEAEIEYRRRDDSRFIASLNLRGVPVGGEVILEGFLEDITSRREAQRALLKSELQFRQLAETIGEVFWLTSREPHKLLYVSPAYERVWGRTCAELYANPRIWTEAILPEDLPRVARDLERLERGQAVQMEYRIRRPDGELRWISDRGYVLADESGEVNIVTGVASDVTERKQAEEALKRYSRLLIVQEEDLRKRIAMELHDDIGQVLTALGLNLAHIGTRLRPQEDDRLRSVLEDSRTLTREISRSVRNLMVELRPTQLEEYGLAMAIGSHAEQFAQRTGIEVAVRTDPGFPRLAPKEEIALFRITQEALNNVSKHACAVSVKISLGSREGVLQLTITDDGMGFSPREDAPHPTGTGWGLTIMRERAELVGGRLRIDSAPGQGTTVRVEIGGAR